VEFYKLERIDIGGNKGKYLSAKVQECYTQFQEFYQKFGGIQYDCSDPEDDSFLADEKLFRDKVLDIDQRISAICTQAFDDCHTPESTYKLILALGTLVERPIIEADIKPKYPEYALMIDRDLAAIKVI
jgi:dynein heavy chain